MSNEILTVLEYMEKEKGIARDAMIDAISIAIATAAQKSINSTAEIRVDINPKSGALKAWSQLQVVDSLIDSKQQIHIDKARQSDKNYNLGDTFEKEIDRNV